MGWVEGGGEDGAEGEEVGDGLEGEVGQGGVVNLFAEGVEGDGGESGDVVGVNYEERVGGFDCCWQDVSIRLSLES